MLKINEIFYSIQGESSYSGEPCIFIRLTGCHLRCTYCDTEYAFYAGKQMSIQQILETIKQYPCKLVEVTGGEPLLQEDVYPLMDTLLDNQYTVLLETSGAKSLEKVPSQVIKIVDLKTPSSQMSSHNRWDTLQHLNSRDEVKFVIGDRGDYEWSRQVIQQYGLSKRCHKVLMSPTHDVLSPTSLGEWIQNDALPVKLQVQLHKYLEKR